MESTGGELEDGKGAIGGMTPDEFVKQTGDYFEAVAASLIEVREAINNHEKGWMILTKEIKKMQEILDGLVRRVDTLKEEE